jgi:hypothetical protein
MRKIGNLPGLAAEAATTIVETAGAAIDDVGIDGALALAIPQLSGSALAASDESRRMVTREAAMAPVFAMSVICIRRERRGAVESPPALRQVHSCRAFPGIAGITEGVLEGMHSRRSRPNGTERGRKRFWGDVEGRTTVAAAVFGRDGNLAAKAMDVTLEAGVPAKHEVYFSISGSTASRAPTMTLCWACGPRGADQAQAYGKATGRITMNFDE